MAEPRPLPLEGRRIVVTRAPEQARAIVDELQKLGAEVLLLPLVRFVEPGDPRPLDAALADLKGFDWVFLTSANAARGLVRRRRKLRLDSWPSNCRVAVVGPITARAARAEGIEVGYVAHVASARALAKELGEQVRGKRILLPRSQLADGTLPAELRRQGADVVEVVAYQTEKPESLDPGVLRELLAARVDLLMFFSPSAFQHLSEEIAPAELKTLANRVRVAAMGPTTSRRIREAGVPVAIEADEQSLAGMLRAICKHFVGKTPVRENVR